MKKWHRSIAAIVAGMLLGTVAFAEDWPQWRGPNRDGKVTGFTPPATWPKALAQKWKVAVGDGDATPALVGDKLFVFTRQGTDEVLSCLNAADGNEIWKKSYPATATVGPPAQAHPGPRSSPAVGEGKVVTLGVGEMLSCLDAASGKMIWRKEFSKEFPKTFPRFYTATSPIIVDKMCVVHLGAEGNGAIMAFDLANGDVKWQWKGDGPAYGSPIVATIEGVKQIVEQTEKNIVGINAADGKLLWQTPYGGGGGGMSNNTATPVIDGSTVIISGRGTKAIKVEKSGDAFAVKDLWNNAQASIQYNTPVLENGLIFGFGFSNGTTVFCLNEKDGATVWTDAPWSRRCNAPRASTRLFHPEISSSTGASARPSRMVAAIITPPLTCCSTTR